MRLGGLRCCALATAIACVVASAASATVARPVRCSASKIDGDHITAANHLTVRGIGCAYAFIVATGLTDSTAREKVKDSLRQTFSTTHNGRRFSWGCTETTLEPPHVAKPGESGTNPEEPGQDYRCSARVASDGHAAGDVSMTFRWWLIGVRYCRPLALPHGFVAKEIQVSRNVTCDQAARWIPAATEKITTAGHPYQQEREVKRFHYRDNAASRGRSLFSCLVASDTEFVGEHGTATWFCKPPGEPFAGREYDWTRQPRNCRRCEGFTEAASLRELRPAELGSR